jgi:hypothetical protein
MRQTKYMKEEIMGLLLGFISSSSLSTDGADWDGNQEMYILLLAVL